MPTDPVFTVSGRVTGLDGVPLPGLVVRAFFRSPQIPERPVGPDVKTDAQGRYQVAAFEEDVRGAGGRDARTLVFISVADGDRALADSDAKPAEGPRAVIDLRVDAKPKEAWLRVYGVVRDPFGQPLGDGLVRAFDRDLRTEQPLGECPIRLGRYDIRYQREQFRKSEKGSADLILKVFGKDQKEMYKSPVQFNAPDEFEFDMVVGGGAFRGPAEWDALQAAFTPLLEGLAPRDLREDDNFQDVSFLAGETGRGALAVVTWILCHRLADKTTADKDALPPEVFFAFLRQGQPFPASETLLKDLQQPDRVALLEETLLRGMADLIPDRQRALLATASAENLVSARLAPRVDAVLATLRRYKVGFAAETRMGGGKGTVGQLLALTPAVRDRTAFLAALTDHTGPLGGFWKKLEDAKVLPPEVVGQVRLTFELGALTRNHIALVGELTRQFQRGALKSKRELARLSRDDWKRLFARKGPDGQPIGVPANVDGATPEAKLDQFATILDRQFERSYPTTSFAAKLARTERSPIPHRAELVTFLDANPEFHLDRHRIDQYLADTKGAVADGQDAARLANGLQAVQRVFRLNPSHQAVEALLGQRVDSAQKVYFMGRGQLATALKDTGLNPLEVKRLYRRAEQTYAAAVALFGEYNRAMTGPLPLAVPGLTLTDEQQARVSTLPNLRTLFGSLDYCECVHCRSVYSPASHFVDVLRFLGERRTNGTPVRDVLLARRPDLGDIELSCENTNTPLPYIDLANEVLEDAIAPPAPVFLAAAILAELTPGTMKAVVLAELNAKQVPIAADATVYAPDSRGRRVVRDARHAYQIAQVGADLELRPTRQTFLSAAELLAHPEYTNAAAYTKLQGEVFPLRMPFDLWHVQTRAYLAHLGVPFPRFLELFQQTTAGVNVPTDPQLDWAWLGLTETERKVITGDLAGKQAWEFWGLAETGNVLPDPGNPLATFSGTWDGILAHVNVFLHRAGISYRELLQLLDTRAVNPTGESFVDDTALGEDEAECDTANFTIEKLTPERLGRAHRFLRLWRKLGCAMWELDLLLPDVDPAPAVTDKLITQAALRTLSAMNRVREKTGLDWRTVHSLYHLIDHTRVVDRGTGAAVQTLYERLFRNRLVDAEASFPPSPDQLAGPISALVPGLLAALSLSEADFTLVLDHLTLTPATILTHTHLSDVHQVATLARAGGLSVDAYTRLQKLWGEDPFAGPTATLRFLALAERVAGSAFTVVELDYLLAHRFNPTAGVAIDDATIVGVLTALRAGLQKLHDDIRRKSEEPVAAYVTSKLGQLPALAKDADLKIALGIIDGTWDGTPAERVLRIDALFAGVLDLPQAKVQLAALAAGLSPADRQAAVDLRFAFVQPPVEQFLLRTQTDEFVRQKIAEVLAVDVPTATAFLVELRKPGDGTRLLRIVNDDRLVTKQADDSYTHPLDATAFADIFTALRLLHKVALTASKLGMTAGEAGWWLSGSHATDMGWIDPQKFPTDTTTPVPIHQWVALEQFFRWKADLPVTGLSPLALVTAVLDATSPAAGHLPALAALTGAAEQDIADLTAAFGWTNLKQALRSTTNLVRLTECVTALRRLGVTAARALSWATAEPGETTADDLKQAVKAKYDLTQWQQVIRPLQDEFRERKRDALVGWLTSLQPGQPNRWPDANSLYAHFLIDVEMCACMPTSRLKQATAAAQLFVQRCLLNLEPDVVADDDLDPKWKQWKWMKRYRVWEANRKVFLYPENWIEPELRDEKSPFFKELENDLQQDEVTGAAVEDAYLAYLEKLDKVANLEIRAMHHEYSSPNTSLLHAFGRTRSNIGAEYYYRQQVNGARWKAWEKVEPEITGNHLVTGVHNRRMYLFWPQFIEKAAEPKTVATPKIDSSTTIPSPDWHWDLSLFWSERKNGKWTPKVLSDAVIEVPHSVTGGNHPENVQFRAVTLPPIRSRVYTTRNPASDAPANLWVFEKVGRGVQGGFDNTFAAIIAPPGGRYANNLIRHDTAELFIYHGVAEGYSPVSPPANVHMNASSIRLLRQIDSRRTHTVIDSAAGSFPPEGEFFVWDSHRTYFVEYVYRTVNVYYSGRQHARTVSRFRFFIHYHPFVELFIKELNAWGVKGLLNRRIQVAPDTVPGAPPRFEFKDYKPDGANVVHPRPVEDVDFTYEGAYAPYNWELFFHIPFYLANKLAANQRFEEALEWFHYIFDPTRSEAPDSLNPQKKFWITKPFFEATTAKYNREKIEKILLAVAKGDATARAQVDEWRDNPFNPHLIARMRTTAYQKNVLIKYVQTLTAWGDQLFRRDTTETMNEATQLYVLAATILGPRPKSVPKAVPNPVKTFYQLQAEGIDAFGNVLDSVENVLPPTGPGRPGDDDAPELPRLDVLYFCIPHNDKLLGLWDTVADRLYKLRHCLNIEGVFRVPALFDPPIDPAALVRAAAAGLDSGAALADANAPLPLYRFTVVIQRALDLSAEVKSLGAAMLAALEKRDAEDFALLRSSNERTLLGKVREVKVKQIDEALRTKEALDAGRKVTEERKAYYEKLLKDGLNTGEETNLALTGVAIVAEIVATVLNAVAAGTSVIPQIKAGASGFGGSPVVTLEFGGEQVSKAVSMGAAISTGVASAAQMGAGVAATLAGYARRADEWDFQKRLAEKELPQLDKQIAAADIRRQAADLDLKGHDTQAENAEKEDEYLRSKFTNRELYDWTVSQLATVYFQTYQLAHDAAKRAERCFRYELGLSDSGYVQFGYWDSLKKGLLSGERLLLDLKRLESAYYEQNRREYELTKHVSVALLDPVALLQLRRNGECFVDVPEAAFDMDYPGHYFRRLKSVSLTIPCTAGPFTTVACTLTLTGSRLRTDGTLLGGKYERDAAGDDPRFRDEAAVRSIATSTAQADAGLFELNFRDERYLPFEGAGSISSWHIKLNKHLPQFDFNTITDVVLHLGYTAREGGDQLRAKAAEAFNARLNELALADARRGLFRVFDLKREFSAEWHRFLYPANPADGQKLLLLDLADRLPAFTRKYTTLKARQVEVVALMKDSVDAVAKLSPIAGTIAMTAESTYQGLQRGAKSLTGAEVTLSSALVPANAWTLELKLASAAANDFKSLPADAVQELFLVVNYTLA